MRIAPYFIALIALGAFGTNIPSIINEWIDGKEDPTVHAAISLRCDSGDADLRAACALDLQRDIDAGIQKPEMIVRLHCTRFTNVWALESKNPSPFCQELYGGWIEG